MMSDEGGRAAAKIIQKENAPHGPKFKKGWLREKNGRKRRGDLHNRRKITNFADRLCARISTAACSVAPLACRRIACRDKQIINNQTIKVDTLSYKTTCPNAQSVEKEWLVIDATDQHLGRLCSKVAKILRGKNMQVMEEYEKLKTQWKNKEITKEEFDKLAKQNSADSAKTRPVVVIKPGPNTTYEGLINALDEMQINQISRYQIDNINATDQGMIDAYIRNHGN